LQRTLLGRERHDLDASVEEGAERGAVRPSRVIGRETKSGEAVLARGRLRLDPDPREGVARRARLAGEREGVAWLAAGADLARRSDPHDPPPVPDVDPIGDPLRL